MKKFSVILFVALTAFLGRAPEASANAPRMITEAEAVAWRGVGRLNVAGRRFCTATLISDRLAVTAAHCLFHPRSGARTQLSEMRFVAGLRLGAYAASRRIVRAAIPDRYSFERSANPASLSFDIALLELSQPIPMAEATAFPIGAPLAGYEPLALVSYSRDRAYAPSIERPCRVRTTMRRIAALSCKVTYGASGAPVFVERGGEMRVSAIVSAMGHGPAGAPIALAVMAEPVIDELREKLESLPARHAPPRSRDSALH
jgi:protease YdgD